MRKPTPKSPAVDDQDTPPVGGLSDMRATVNACRRCPLYKDATQGVPGEGPAHAAIMLVGEQPGDKEDLVGQPFVGPAGRLLDRALAEARIARESVFVTNAVKHFKFEPRGKRRLHKKPNAYEIDRCRWWLGMELALVRPAIVVALGATGARGLLGRPVTISKVRGEVLKLEDGTPAFVTIHPSALLRIKDDADKQVQYRAFVADLRRAAAFVRELAA